MTPMKQLEESYEKGNVQAGFDMAVRYYNGEGTDINHAKALKLFYASAEKGHADSAFALAEIHHAGKGAAKNIQEATMWYRRAGEKGHVEAQFRLGLIYGHGIFKNEGVAVNSELAFRWFDLAAKQGHPHAQYELGKMYLEGKLDDGLAAVLWITRAAMQGHPTAQYELGVLFKEGDLVIQDDKTAMQWFELAAASGNEKAVKALEEMGSALEGKKLPEEAGDKKQKPAIVKRDPGKKNIDQRKNFFDADKAAHADDADGVRDVYELSKTLPYGVLMDYLKGSMERLSEN